MCVIVFCLFVAVSSSKVDCLDRRDSDVPSAWWVVCINLSFSDAVTIVFSVSAWDGGQSLLDKEHAVDKAQELKRRMSEMYDEEIDRGRVSN